VTGVVGFTKGVALETATTGITCNAICPDWVLTPLVQKRIDALAAREKLDPEEASVKLPGEKQPSLEFTTPEELGAPAAFLCLDAAVDTNGLPVHLAFTPGEAPVLVFCVGTHKSGQVTHGLGYT
jgi:3-hydroxybutyrate dehydrogenase